VNSLEEVSGTVYELNERPGLADRSMALALHMAGDISPHVESAMAQMNHGEAQIVLDRRPRGVWDRRGDLLAWEVGWTLIDHRGYILRAAVRAPVGSEPWVELIIDGEVTFTGMLDVARTGRGLGRTELGAELVAALLRVFSLNSVPTATVPDMQ